MALAAGAEAVRRGAKPAEARLLVDLVRKASEALRAPSGLVLLLGEKTVEGEGFSFRAPLAALGREPLSLDRDCRVKVRLDLEKVVEEVKLALGGEGRE